MTYQPDWIVEAMGLKPITSGRSGPDQGASGARSGLTSLTFPASGSGGQAYNRTMIVSDLTHRVSEFRVFAADGKSLLAQATIKKYRDVSAAGSSTPEVRRRDDRRGDPAACPRVSSSNGRESSSPSMCH